MLRMLARLCDGQDPVAMELDFGDLVEPFTIAPVIELSLVDAKTLYIELGKELAKALKPAKKAKQKGKK
jgi:hypothetical protein